MSSNLSLTERLRQKKPGAASVLSQISDGSTGRRTKRNKENKKREKVEQNALIDLTADTSPQVKRRRTSRRTNKMSEKFLYTNWFDDEFVQHAIGNGCNRDYANNVKTWLDFVAAIGEENKKKFPIREQQKNDCTVMSAISAYEVQNRKRWLKDISKVGAIKQTIEKGAHLQDTIPRIWGSSNPYNLATKDVCIPLNN